MTVFLPLYWQRYKGCQIDSVLGDLHFADTSKKVSDEDAPGIPLEEVSAVTRSGHTLTLRAHLKLKPTHSYQSNETDTQTKRLITGCQVLKAPLFPNGCALYLSCKLSEMNTKKKNKNYHLNNICSCTFSH